MAKHSFDQMLDMSLEELAAEGFGKAKASKGGSKGSRSSPYAGGESGGSRVYVGNLPYSASWQDVKDHMRQIGNVVHCDIIAQPGTACGSKGCAVVQFSTPEEAAKAIAELTDTLIGGRAIFVREDREEDKGKGKGKGAKGTQGTSVYVGNLPYSVSWQDLKDHMRTAGDVVRCDIMEAPGKAMNSKGCAIVKYASAVQAARAISTLTDTVLKGRAIFVREDREAFSGASAGYVSSWSASGRRNSGACRVFVGNLPYSASWQDLKDHMRQAGDVLRCEILGQPGTALGSKGCGLVEFVSARDAQRAIYELTDTILRGRAIWVREDREA